MHSCQTLADVGRPVRVCIARCAVSLLTAALLNGCGSGDQGPERVVVSGTVAYNGKAIPEGRIRFMPVPTSPVPMASGRIIDGKYRIDTRGGVAVGTYKIRIETFGKVAISPKPGTAASPASLIGAPGNQYLPARYNADTQLEFTIEPGGREITKNFDLTD